MPTNKWRTNDGNFKKRRLAVATVNQGKVTDEGEGFQPGAGEEQDNGGISE